MRRTFDAEATSVRDAREFVRSRLEVVGCSHEMVGDCVLLIGELATNVVDHADSATFVVDVREGNEVHIDVRDADAGRHVLEPVDGALDRPRGRGLFLVDSLARRWGVDYHPDGKSVWFELPYP